MRVKNLLAWTVASVSVVGIGPATLWAADAVEIVRIDTIPGGDTACPNTPAEAQRYVLSDGRTVLRCGGPIADPVGFLNGAAVQGLTVSGLAAGVAVPKAEPDASTDTTAQPAEPVLEGPAASQATLPDVAAAPAPSSAAAPVAGGPIGSGAWPEIETPNAADQNAEQNAASGDTAGGQTTPGHAAVSDSAATDSAGADSVETSDDTADDGSDQAQPAPADIASETPVEPDTTPSAESDSAQAVDAGPAEPATPVAPAEPTVQSATTTTPRPEEKPAPDSKPRRAAAPAGRAPAGPAPTGRCADAAACYVQLGAFGEKKNADRAKAVLRSLHLPVSVQQIRLRDGRQLTAVMAGPMDAASAERALGEIRGCGFKAAVLR